MTAPRAFAIVARLRDEVDITTVTTDLYATVRDAVKPATLGLWIRDARASVLGPPINARHGNRNMMTPVTIPGRPAARMTRT